MSDQDHSIHGTCVAFGNDGALIRGPSGVGKSDLAFRYANLPDADCQLVGDDRIFLKSINNKLIVSGAEKLQGLIEVRSVGIIPIEFKESAQLKLIIDLSGPEDAPRMQVPFDDNCYEDIMGYRLPCVKLYSFEPSAPYKVLALIRLAAQL